LSLISSYLHLVQSVHSFEVVICHHDERRKDFLFFFEQKFSCYLVNYFSYEKFFKELCFCVSEMDSVTLCHLSIGLTALSKGAEVDLGGSISFEQILKLFSNFEVIKSKTAFDTVSIPNSSHLDINNIPSNLSSTNDTFMNTIHITKINSCQQKFSSSFRRFSICLCLTFVILLLLNLSFAKYHLKISFMNHGKLIHEVIFNLLKLITYWKMIDWTFFMISILICKIDLNYERNW